MSDLLAQSNLPSFSLFDFFPAGAVILLLGIVYMVLFGRKLLPDRKDKMTLGKFDLMTELNKLYHINEIIYESQDNLQL